MQEDNAPPHTANKTFENIRNRIFEFLEYPPYSLDLVSSDFHMFGPFERQGLVGFMFRKKSM